MRKDNKQIHLPELSLVLLIGASSSGKSSFARKHFKPTEVVSSDYCRGLVSDDENSLTASDDAFELARYITAKRFKNGLLTVIDATNVQENSRKDWAKLAREYHVLPTAIVFNLPEKVCVERSTLRPDRNLGSHVIPQQISQLKRGLRRLKIEGFRHVIELNSQEEVDAVEEIIRDPLYNNKKQEKGPFDIIGDIHGCYDELVMLLQQLGYKHENENWLHPEGRKPVFLGDLVDRGPKTPEVLKLVMGMVKTGSALCVPGNHDIKLLKWFNGKNVQAKHGLQQSIDQLEKETPAFREEARKFIDSLVSHYVLDDGNLIVAHAGIKEEMQGRGSGAVREFCLFGETTGEIDEFGLPVRYNWASEYRGKAMVVYGHTPVPEAQWLNRTIDIDTGCVFGGKLTALRYPEKELVSVPSLATYCEPSRPIIPTTGIITSLQQQYDDILDISDFMGKHIVPTQYAHNVTIREENAIAALEVMSRFAVNPKWLIYLPPTMSPVETSKLEDYLEHPKEAFDYYRGVGVEKVICEEKHMGSRTIIIVGKNEAAIQEAFGITNEGIGVIYTRTGRSWFNDKETEQAFLQRINTALEQSGFYEKFQTDWVCLDTELMPWSAKAQSLLEKQYSAVGAAATHALQSTLQNLQQAVLHNPEVTFLLDKYQTKQQQVEQYIKSYQQYCWPVNSLDDFKLAPFHILATAGKSWTDKDHEWHMEQIENICRADPSILKATTYKVVHLQDMESIQEATDWWVSMTGAGGEGMVVKPSQYIHVNGAKLAQPAVKVRGREYLRIIYGPEYTSPENLIRLKSRGLSSKRNLALREFSLGIEGLQRFVNQEPLQKIHECVFGVLALESEPVDPRL
ncbi:polynucleotide 3'-phosphatase /polynucleotide 5'-hydroxyl-kinase /polynucleotide 2',3'-cyclic phosphate phosphodiesterase [Chitinophaga sp. CF118]|uniref:polynucleotide kinase-phosphatase n=1 Tax=Chitinophaga sp. CF118 TaxID=1884367 RepID=UPI0008ED5B88|nr:polynucleotide kinase-phosphatase [Chitinophaga sp. CF118]SFD23433.1 polynucleotide 3'-phosphatase /polynucleotide 5'-hydroxyl-kinase /polynucleotide 2',3'-cyclic phosphate phosphodiesterase [Chitinophaga sp. CF118]